MTAKASKTKARNEDPVLTISVEERIRRRAYELYVVRGGEHGHDIDDWLQAETELMAERLQSPIQAKPKKERKAGAKAPPKTPRGKTKSPRSAKQANTEEERGDD